MKEIKYVPRMVIENGVKIKPSFKGEISILVPTYKDRLKLIKDLRYEVKDGEVKVRDNHFDSAEMIAELVEKHVKKVDLECVETGEKISSLEDLGYSLEGSKVINELGNLLLGGVKLGKA